ncbi:MAG: hydantoinase [Planctomycetota bacterium]|nr:MAG: hydantoinase [Planctomycetota bacterium]REK44588.1 MAG: hydantoinase [Planctomycetota bacterium]
MPGEPWQFWIDVGGTFTDVIARDDRGTLHRCKLLSSGVFQGAGHLDAACRTLVDPQRASDPAHFFDGYTLRLRDSAGRCLAEANVAEFVADCGTLRLAEPLELSLAEPSQPVTYELTSGEPAPLVAIRYLLSLGLRESLPGVRVRLGTTRGTNALLTRSGATTAFVTTRGFGDILRIGDQDRPALFELSVVKREPLFAVTLEIDERLTHDGQVLTPLDEPAVRRDLQQLRAQGIESLAICLLNGYAQPQHEARVAEIAAEVGFRHVDTSAQTAPLVKLVARGDTTVVDAYLTPILRDYVDQLRAKLADGDLRLMTSAGGLVRGDEFSGKDSILSGPAGGVVGFARAAAAVAADETSVRAIGFDMGGTSTDVARYDGTFRRVYEGVKASVRIVAPMMAIETVAAGGGSCCDFDGVKLVVGPASAGADPGPACYGRGGPLTVTDVNLTLGKILPEYFPFPLDRAAAARRLDELIDVIERQTGHRYRPIELADGFLKIANANMVAAIRSISIAEGVDVRDYVLVAFGGAAGQHACAVARELGMRRVLLHPDAGILSAWGTGLAEVTRHAVAGLYRPYDAAIEEPLAQTFARLASEARSQLLAEGVAAEEIGERRALDLRYQGLDNYLTIPCPADGDYAAAYEIEHEQLYGYRHAGRALEVVAARVEVIGRGAEALPPSRPAPPRTATSQAETQIYFDARPHTAAVYRREQLQPGDVIEGPAIVLEDNSTIVVDPDWRAEVYTGGELLLSDGGNVQPAQVSTTSDPIMLEVFNNQFAAIAAQMGVTLRNTATSVNVKERLDFSCAIFTADGDLVVNAPHMPVHLGAMSQTVRCILADNPDMRPGDVFLTNDPYRGGSHLPDVTVVTPMFDEAGERILFFTASRAHHAEIGGITPGSMPPASRNLAEEGVLIRNFRLVAAGEPRFDALRELLTSAPYPTRAVEHNLADVSAQVAANNQGVGDLCELCRRYSVAVVEAYTRHIQDAAETKMRAALKQLPDGTATFVDYLDYVEPPDESESRDRVTIASAPIEVAVTITGDRARVDFNGSGPVLPNNLNANRAIVTAAVMYVMRCLIDEDIPLNEGVLAPIEIVLPEGLLHPPAAAVAEDCAAVVGGNVETSQRVVDVLLGALSLAAASQGTMNNLLFGDAEFGYYETICGGSGATPQAAGADAVHTHMTNTRITDPEVLEQRFPVRVRRFAIRRGSGGAGELSGGAGVVRELEFLRSLEVSMLATRRGPHPPYGIAGGKPGALGRAILERRDGTKIELPPQVSFKVERGDVLTIETPGGGGWGRAREVGQP